MTSETIPCSLVIRHPTEGRAYEIRNENARSRGIVSGGKPDPPNFYFRLGRRSEEPLPPFP